MPFCKLLPFCVALVLVGCSLTPDCQRLAMPVPQQFSPSQNGLVSIADDYQNAGWYTFFIDNQVKTLIDGTLVSNRDSYVVTLKVREIRVQYHPTDADRYPQLNDEGSGSWNDSLRGNTAMTWEFSTGLNASFDLDSFGRLKNTSEAEWQNYLAIEEAQCTVRVLLAPNTAQNYFDQQLAYAQLQTAEETLRSCQQSYVFVKKQLLTGSSNVLTLEQTRGVTESTCNDIAKRQGELAQANNVL